MATITELYQNGRDIWHTLQTIRNTTSVTSAERGQPRTIASRVERLNAQKKDLERIWSSVRQPQPPHEADIYNAEIENHNTAINHLESLAKKALSDCCVTGQFIGIGFINSKPPKITAIHPNEWAFLDIDFRDSSANFEDTIYKKIKLIAAVSLTDKELDILVAEYKNYSLSTNKNQDANSNKNHSPTVKNYYLMGDTYNIQQAAAAGKNATANHTTLNQDNHTTSVDLMELAIQLSKLRAEMRQQADTTEHDESLGAIAAAERSVSSNDIGLAMRHMKKAGKWALSIAEKISVDLAAKMIDQSLNS